MKSHRRNARRFQSFTYLQEFLPGSRYFQTVLFKDRLIVINTDIVTAVGKGIISTVLLFGHFQGRRVDVIQKRLSAQILHIPVRHLLSKLHLCRIIRKDHRNIAGRNARCQNRSRIRHRIHLDHDIRILRIEFINDRLVSLLRSFLAFLLEKLDRKHLSCRLLVRRVFRSLPRVLSIRLLRFLLRCFIPVLCRLCGLPASRQSCERHRCT